MRTLLLTRAWEARKAGQAFEAGRRIGATRAGLTLDQPFGSGTHAGRIAAPQGSVVRVCDIAAGAPAGETEVRRS